MRRVHCVKVTVDNEHRISCILLVSLSSPYFLVCLTLEDWTDMLSRNVGMELPFYAE